MKGYIYKIVNKLNNKCYIGQTLNLEKRFRQHQHSKDNFYVHCSIRKYGVDNFDFIKLEEIEFNSIEELKSILNQKEIEYIKLYKSAEKEFGYNLTLGGDGMVASELTREKLRKNHSGCWKNRHHTEEAKRKIGEYQRSRDRSNLNYKHSDETKRKISKANKDRLPHNAVKIKCIENNTIYNSIKKASKDLKLNADMISECIKGIRESYKGYTFIKI